MAWQPLALCSSLTAIAGLVAQPLGWDNGFRHRRRIR